MTIAEILRWVARVYSWWLLLIFLRAKVQNLVASNYKWAKANFRMEWWLYQTFGI